MRCDTFHSIGFTLFLFRSQKKTNQKQMNILKRAHTLLKDSITAKAFTQNYLAISKWMREKRISYSDQHLIVFFFILSSWTHTALTKRYTLLHLSWYFFITTDFLCAQNKSAKVPRHKYKFIDKRTTSMNEQK